MIIDQIKKMPTYAIFFFSLILYKLGLASLDINYADGTSKNLVYSISNYGQVPYGAKISGELMISIPLNACDPVKSSEDLSLSHRKHQEHFALLAVRGNCTFMAKTAFAQELGASLLIVVDNIIEMTENITPMSLNEDDNRNYYIPTLLISKNDGDFILEKAKNNMDISFNVNFEMKKSSQVKFSFWITSSSNQSFSLVKSFKNNYKKIMDSQFQNISFEAHYTGLFHCKFCNFTDYTYFPDNCISGGRYCSAYPEESHPSLGVYYILEDLRELCLYKSEISIWWNYLSEFEEKCLNMDPKSYENCSLMIIRSIEKELQITDLEKRVQTCFNSSFFLGANDKEINIFANDNLLLKEERRVSIENGIGFWPSVTINNDSYKGNLNGDLVFSAICQVFEEKPNFCLIEEEKNDELINKNIIIMVLMLIVFILCVTLIIYCSKYKKIKESKMKALEISEIIGRYQVLNEEKHNRA